MKVFIDAELAKRIQLAANNEELDHEDFTRKLLRWALPYYYSASSLWVLKQAVVTVPKLMPLGSVRKAKKQGTRVRREPRKP